MIQSSDLYECDVCGVDLGLTALRVVVEERIVSCWSCSEGPVGHRRIMPECPTHHHLRAHRHRVLDRGALFKWARESNA